jgi:hypothetical protein
LSIWWSLVGVEVEAKTVVVEVVLEDSELEQDCP